MATVTNDIIYSTTLPSNAPSVVLTIPSGYTHIRINASLKSDSLVNTFLRLNGVTSNDYSWTRMYGTGSLKSSQQAQNSNAIFLGDSGTSDFTSDEIYINNYLNTNFFKNVLVRSSATSAVQESTGTWRSTSAVTSVTIYVASGNFVAGSTIKVYGILAAEVSPKATGGTVYTDNTHFYHVFGTSGTFTPTQSLSADALIVGGGGGGGLNFGSGGGGGKVTTLTSQSLTATGYTVTVGGGGAGATGGGGSGSTGGTSSFNGTSSVGGNGGGPGAATGGTSGNGFAGGTGYYPGPPDVSGGGGGGAAEVGYNSVSATGPLGGNGLSYAFPHGELKYFGGGGNGGCATYSSNAGWGWFPRVAPTKTSLGGGALGGGGHAQFGYKYRGNGDAGVANTGGGGGGGSWDNSGYGYYGGTGGSGIVVIKYLKA